MEWFGEHAIQQQFQGVGSLSKLSVPFACGVSTPEQFIGDIERCEDREAQRIARGRLVTCRPDLVVDVARQSNDVFRVKRAADRISLAADLNGDDASLVFHGALEIQRFQLVEHVSNTSPYDLALLFKARYLRSQRLGRCETAA